MFPYVLASSAYVPGLTGTDTKQTTHSHFYSTVYMNTNFAGPLIFTYSDTWTPPLLEKVTIVALIFHVWS